MLSMYKSTRGLDFTLKRLKESEVQEGEEIEILEYEQLKDENSTLKDKLGDRMKEVDSSKFKISYAIQILAHVRTKMSNMTVSCVVGVFNGNRHGNSATYKVHFFIPGLIILGGHWLWGG